MGTEVRDIKSTLTIVLIQGQGKSFYNWRKGCFKHVKTHGRVTSHMFVKQKLKDLQRRY